MGKGQAPVGPSTQPRRSIIVNLEHIKAIITVDKVLVVNYGQDEAGTRVGGWARALVHGCCTPVPATLAGPLTWKSAGVQQCESQEVVLSSTQAEAPHLRARALPPGSPTLLRHRCPKRPP